MSTVNFTNTLELPFLLIAVFFAFRTAQALKGGAFGQGMRLVAFGSLVMAIGHIHMQVDALFGFNLFNSLLGSIGGNIAWIAALIVTWVLTGLGFVSIYKAARVK
ncbi:MAG: hypothetical protein AB1750_10970 [Chloroflexota bacterium]